MKRFMILPLLLLFSAAVADGDPYKGTDEQGVVSFTDNPALIHSRHPSETAKAEEDISRDPKVLQELMQEVEKPRQDKSATPRAVAVSLPISR